MWTQILLMTLVCNLVTGESFQRITRKNIQEESIQKSGPNQRVLSYMRLPGISYIEKLSNVLPIKYDKDVIDNLPKSFDPRNKWPNCPSLNEIRDQGKCGSCWAVSTVSAMTDRVCTYSNGTKHFHFSAQDLLTCMSKDGCDGNHPRFAWKMWVKEGIVSGGNYGSQGGCKPYSIAPCLKKANACKSVPTPKCKRSCKQGYNASYKKDKRRGKREYKVIGEENIMVELFRNGPLVSTFRMFEDFAEYAGGVYQHKHGKTLDFHAVKLMGWGVEKGKKYWLVANSWGTDFGEKGFFKILRGVNECGIERYATAGEPLLSDY